MAPRYWFSNKFFVFNSSIFMSKWKRPYRSARIYQRCKQVKPRSVINEKYFGQFENFKHNPTSWYHRPIHYRQTWKKLVKFRIIFAGPESIFVGSIYICNNFLKESRVLGIRNLGLKKIVRMLRLKIIQLCINVPVFWEGQLEVFST